MQNSAKYYLHNIQLTGERIRGNISPSDVNRAGKTQTILENLYTCITPFQSSFFVYFFAAEVRRKTSASEELAHLTK